MKNKMFFHVLGFLFFIQLFIFVTSCIALWTLYQLDMGKDVVDVRSYLKYAFMVEIVIHLIAFSSWTYYFRDLVNLKVQRLKRPQF